MIEWLPWLPTKSYYTNLKFFETLKDTPNSSEGFRFVAFLVLEILGVLFDPPLVLGVGTKTLGARRLKMEYGKRLNPECSLRTPKGIKGTRQKVIVIHNPSEIDQNQELLVRFPHLGSDDVIIPGMANLSFNIELTSTVDTNRTLVSNIGRAIVKKLAVKFEGNEIMSIDDYDLFTCYRDLWKTKSEKRNAI